MVCTIVRNHASESDCYPGDLIGSEYKEEIEKLQKQFARAKESFDRRVQLEIFAAIDEISTFMFCSLSLY